MELKTFKSSNGRETITYYRFIPDGEIKQVVQLIHGMSEHIKRYQEFAYFLNKNGIAVYGHDHMAHGESAYKDLGEFLNKDQAYFMVKDASLLNEIIRKDYPSLPVTIFCHSMGSFIGRILAAKYPATADKIIICGTSGSNPIAFIGKYITLFLMKTKGKDYRSKLIDDLSLGSYNRHFKDATTTCDWLSTDPLEVQKFLDDPKCGFLFNVAGSATLVDLVSQANHRKIYSLTKSRLPIFIISGSMDPVSGFGKGAHEVFTNYKKHGCNHTSLKLYEGLRHEIILDVTKEEVWKDILEFIEK